MSVSMRMPPDESPEDDAERSPLNKPARRASIEVYGTMEDGSVRSGRVFLDELDIRVYPWRWVILLLFSLLSATNNAISFQYSPIVHLSREFFDCTTGDVHVLVLVHFVAYLGLSVIGSYFVEAAGLYTVVVVGAVVQAAGAWVRVWGSGFATSHVGRYGAVLLGQAIASVAAPAFVNPPPLLASTWFEERERSLATALAVQANFVGIALAFAVAPHVVRSADDMPALDWGVALAASALALLAVALFREGPPNPPTLRAALSAARPAPRPALRLTVRQSLALFARRGFVHTVVAFAVAETVFNVVPIFLNQSLVPVGFSPQFVGWLGAAFIVAGAAGGFLAGAVVDATRAHKGAMVVSLACAAGAMGLFAKEAEHPHAHVAVSAAVVAVGVCMGPVEPIGTELGCEATEPAPEATVCAVQTVLGQVCSLLAVPLLDALKDPKTESMYSANLATAGAIGAAALLFAFFPRSPRAEAGEGVLWEEGEAGEGEGPRAAALEHAMAYAAAVHR